MKFIGREKELTKLNSLFNKKSASLIVIRGRRRIGKSRLIEEFTKNYSTFNFIGMHPSTNFSSQKQKEHFGWQLATQVGQIPFNDNDWNSLFLRLANYTKEHRHIIVFDEISWMGSKDPTFLAKLKTAWDYNFKKNPKLILIICGSVSSWIEKNILSSTGFFGRISLDMTLKELPLNQCNSIWKSTHISPYEKLKLLAVTGGVPRYLEEIDPHKSAEENIRELCFEEYGILYNEYEHIFYDLFGERSNTYKDIVECLVSGPKEINEIIKELKLPDSGTISFYLKDLKLAGFLSRDYSWNIKTGEVSKTSRYRLSDNYLRFYLKYTLPNKPKIELGQYRSVSLYSLDKWSTIMGLQFENLVLNNRHLVKSAMNLPLEQVVFDNPYYQKATKKKEGCQVDYMIQTKEGVIYVCEIKFSKSPIRMEVITEVEKKLQALSVPKGVSLRSVLIHVNGVTENLEEEQYFSHIIDFSKFLEK